MRARGLIGQVCGALLAATLLLAPLPARAQAVPDQAETARLVWSTLIALDHANRTGNYAVLRDLGSESFRAANDPARLADIFRVLRQEDPGLGRTVQLTPLYDAPPALEEGGVLRLRGGFPTRPLVVRFDLAFEWQNGAWMIAELGISTFDATEAAQPEN